MGNLHKLIENVMASLLRSLFEFVVVTTVLLVFLLFSPLFLDCDPESFDSELPKSYTGGLAVNDRMNKAEKLHEGLLKWPESLAVYQGEIYTGINDGQIVKVTTNGVKPIVRTGKKICEGQWEEAECGRPLGMRFDKKGKLYVADAIFGLMVVDVKNAKKSFLLQSTNKVENSNLTFLNDIVLDEDSDTIYMTQSSTKWPITKVVYATMNHESSGRLLSYNLKTKEVKVLSTGLYFANGIELSPDKQRLLIAECTSHRILQYFIAGPNKGKMETLIKGLPGEPDNIRKAKSGGYWIALNTARIESTATLLDKLGPYPIVRKFVMRFLHAIGSLVTYVAQYVPYPVVKSVAFDILSGRFMVDIIPSYGMIIRVDDQGKIVESLHSPDGKFAHFSEVLEYEGHLYIGSWRNKFLAKLKV